MNNDESIHHNKVWNKECNEEKILIVKKYKLLEKTYLVAIYKIRYNLWL